MIQTNIWKPDTCGCEITYQWDDSVDQSQRVHTTIDSKPCAEHVGIDHADVHQKALVKNNFKNRSIATVAKSLGLSDEEHSSMKWEYIDGELNLTLPDSVKDKTTAQQAVAADGVVVN